METVIPTAAEVRALLSKLSTKQLEQLSVLSGVPAPTIFKIRYDDTKNPGIDTVGKFLPFIAKAGESEAKEAA